MQQFRKLVCIMTMLLMLANTLVFAVSASEEKSSSIDEQATATEMHKFNALNFLTQIGVVDFQSDGDLQSDGEVSRGIFAAMLTRMLGVSDADLSDQEQTFSDVSRENPNFGYIHVVSKMGIMGNITDNVFRPDDAITYNEVIKCLVSAIGYDIVAKNRGGFPVGYLAVASEQGITKSIKISNEEKATLNNISKLISNALDVDIYKQVSFNDTIELRSEKGKTLLSEMLKIEKIKGIVTASGDTALYGESTLNDEEVEFANKFVYKIGTSDIENFLGYEMVAYAKEMSAEEDKTIIYAYNENTNVIKVDAYDIKSVDVNSKQLTYFDKAKGDGKDETLDFTSDIKVIYNGSLYSSALSQILKPVAGNVTLLDNNNDETYDVAFVSEIKTYVVLSNNTDTYEVQDRFSGDIIVLDESKTSPKVYISLDGGKVSLSDINEWDVIDIYQDKKNTKINVEVSNTYFTAKPQEILDDDKVKINDVEYKIAKSYLNELAKDASAQSVYAVPITLDKVSTFHLNSKGEIAAVEVGMPATSEYGYVTKMSSSKSGIVDQVQVKMFQATGEFGVFDFADKVQLTYPLSSAEVVTEKVDCEKLSESKYKLYNYDSSGILKFTPQLVIYKVNEDNKISELKVAIDVTASSNTTDIQRFVTNQVYRKNLSYTTSKKAFKAGASAFVDSNNLPEYFVDSSTKIFKIPKSDSKQSILDDESQYEIGGSFGNDSYYVEGYNASISKCIKVAIMYTEVGDVAFGDPFKIVDKVTNIINPEGDLVKKLNVYENGKPVAKIVKSNVSVIEYDKTPSSMSALAFGDLILWYVDKNNEVSSIVRYVKASALTNSNKIWPDTGVDNIQKPYSQYSGKYKPACIQGEVYTRDGDYIAIINEDGISTSTHKYSSKNVFIVDLGDDKFTLGSKSDISAGSFIFIHIYEGSIKNIYLYRFN